MLESQVLVGTVVVVIVAAGGGVGVEPLFYSRQHPVLYENSPLCLETGFSACSPLL